MPFSNFIVQLFSKLDTIIIGAQEISWKRRNISNNLFFKIDLSNLTQMKMHIKQFFYWKVGCKAKPTTWSGRYIIDGF